MIGYKSNAQEVINKLITNLKPEKLDKMYREMAMSMYASNLRRVHNDGLNVSGSKIGSYSTKPLYVSPRGFRSFPLKGKSGKTTFKNGKRHKTGYFDGYGKFKEAIGYSTTVNLQATGRLRLDFRVLKQGSGYVIGFLSSYGKKISEGNEDHFNTTIWGISDEDRQVNTAIIQRYLAELK